MKIRRCKCGRSYGFLNKPDPDMYAVWLLVHQPCYLDTKEVAA